MANLLPAAVVINDTWTEGGTNSRIFNAVEATLTLTGQGSLTNLIPAALFGMINIKEVRNARNTSSVAYGAVPSYDHANVVLKAIAPVQKTYVATGRNGAGTFTVTGITTGETIVSVVDLTTPLAANAALYTATSTNTVTTTDATNQSAKALLITTTTTLAAPVDVTDTIKLVVVGY